MDLLCFVVPASREADRDESRALAFDAEVLLFERSR
jgi:hypothetical protein